MSVDSNVYPEFYGFLDGGRTWQGNQERDTDT